MERPSMALKRDRWIAAAKHRPTNDFAGRRPQRTAFAKDRRQGAVKHGVDGCVLVGHHKQS